MNIGKLIGHLITVAMILGTLGILAEITQELKRQAADTAQHGMVSLGAFNRRLEKGR